MSIQMIPNQLYVKALHSEIQKYEARVRIADNIINSCKSGSITREKLLRIEHQAAIKNRSLNVIEMLKVKLNHV